MIDGVKCSLVDKNRDVKYYNEERVYYYGIFGNRTVFVQYMRILLWPMKN